MTSVNLVVPTVENQYAARLQFNYTTGGRFIGLFSMRRSIRVILLSAILTTILLGFFYPSRGLAPIALSPIHSRKRQLNSTILSLVENERLDEMVESVRSLEEVYNKHYGYPWTFFNDRPFSDDFKAKIQAQTRSVCTFHLIDGRDWEVPASVDRQLMAKAFQTLKAHRVRYADRLSYHQMCRWFSGFFYRHSALDEFRYYWRVEPGVRFLCDIAEDPFQVMQDKDKRYGFVIAVYDAPESIESLWPTTRELLQSHPHIPLASNHSLDFILDSANEHDAGGYNTCHFWSNFEIADLNFFRSAEYETFFRYLDETNKFFYERWGDAPVHTIAAALFLNSSQIHYFSDIGYHHSPFMNCPALPRCQQFCTAGQFTEPGLGLEDADCKSLWLTHEAKSASDNQLQSAAVRNGG